MAPEAFFLPVADGQRFCLFHSSRESPQGALIYLHPFAEEMNKSRRMAALQSRLFASTGYAVLQIDLHGCGDSSGDFGDASWQGWLEDVRQAHAWLRERCAAPLWLWGLRTGCLLAAQAAGKLGEEANLLFWQPTISGRQCLQQFLRLKVAAGMITGDSKGVMEDLKRKLAQGQTVEIAGYALSPSLASDLETAELVPPAQPGRLAWLELTNRPDATLAPASAKCIDQWRAAGCKADAQVLPGPAFWQTTEIEEVPALLAATLAAVNAAKA